eukprot:5782247-Ditylum_brightwellii.AAC.1
MQFLVATSLPVFAGIVYGSTCVYVASVCRCNKSAESLGTQFQPTHNPMNQSGPRPDRVQVSSQRLTVLAH